MTSEQRELNQDQSKTGKGEKGEKGETIVVDSEVPEGDMITEESTEEDIFKDELEKVKKSLKEAGFSERVVGAFYEVMRKDVQYESLLREWFDDIKHEIKLYEMAVNYVKEEAETMEPRSYKARRLFYQRITVPLVLSRDSIFITVRNTSPGYTLNSSVHALMSGLEFHIEILNNLLKDLEKDGEGLDDIVGSAVEHIKGRIIKLEKVHEKFSLECEELTDRRNKLIEDIEELRKKCVSVEDDVWY